MSSNKVMDCSFNHLPVDVISLLISYLKFREWGILDNAFSTHSEERDRCCYIGDEGVTIIAKKLHKLKFLDVSSCPDVSKMMQFLQLLKV